MESGGINVPNGDVFWCDMRLNPAELKVIGAIELDAEESYSAVARRLGLRASRVQRILSRLTEQRILLGRIAVIDVARLGYIECGLSLATVYRSPDQRARMLNFLMQNARVSWLAQAGGTKDLLLNLVVRNPVEVVEFLNRLTAEFPTCLKGKSFYQRTFRVRLARGMFGQRGQNHKSYKFYQGIDTVAVDDTDRIILKTISKHIHISFRDLAALCAIPLSTVLRRIEVLKKEKVLLGFGTRIDVAQLGYQQFRILIELRTISKSIKQRVLQLCERYQFVKVFAECLGTWDYEIEIDTKDPSEISVFVSRLYDECSEEIGSVVTLPIFTIEKHTSFPVFQES